MRMLNYLVVYNRKQGSKLKYAAILLKSVHPQGGDKDSETSSRRKSKLFVRFLSKLSDLRTIIYILKKQACEPLHIFYFLLYLFSAAAHLDPDLHNHKNTCDNILQPNYQYQYV